MEVTSKKPTHFWTSYRVWHDAEFVDEIQTKVLTRIATLSRVYLIDTGNEGRARDSRHPPRSTRLSISH